MTISYLDYKYIFYMNKPVLWSDEDTNGDRRDRISKDHSNVSDSFDGTDNM